MCLLKVRRTEGRSLQKTRLISAVKKRKDSMQDSSVINILKSTRRSDILSSCVS